MAINFEDFPPEAQARIRAMNPGAFPEEAPARPKPTAPTGQVRPRRGNPLLTPGPAGVPRSARLPGGTVPGEGRRAAFSAFDRPAEAPSSPPPGAPGPAREKPYVDVAAEAADAVRQRNEYKAQAQAAGRGAEQPGPAPLHPGLFGRLRAGFDRVGQNLAADRHGMGIIAADTAALSAIHRSPSIPGIMAFASGLHREPIYRRMEREQEMNWYSHHGEPATGSMAPRPRARTRARAVPLHFD